MTLSADEQVEELRRTADELLITVIERAKAAGTVREDFVGEDLLLLLIATAAVTDVTRADAPAAWRRFVAWPWIPSAAAARPGLSRRCPRLRRTPLIRPNPLANPARGSTRRRLDAGFMSS
jgi:hypothetical protein